MLFSTGPSAVLTLCTIIPPESGCLNLIFRHKLLIDNLTFKEGKHHADLLTVSLFFLTPLVRYRDAIRSCADPFMFKAWRC